MVFANDCNLNVAIMYITAYVTKFEEAFSMVVPMRLSGCKADILFLQLVGKCSTQSSPSCMSLSVLWLDISFAAGPKSKKSGKGAGDAPKESVLTKEMKSTTVFGANILKEGTDPKILPDSEYPDWLFHLLDKRPPLSER
ncbi:uncharacterized protein A4U43_C08F10060 [Asparagus officinalis]|nr:uncharacterized protein A4U43_C08F10060 [Asparagus officinalis]